MGSKHWVKGNCVIQFINLIMVQNFILHGLSVRCLNFLLGCLHFLCSKVFFMHLVKVFELELHFLTRGIYVNDLPSSDIVFFQLFEGIITVLPRFLLLIFFVSQNYFFVLPVSVIFVFYVGFRIINCLQGTDKFFL